MSENNLVNLGELSKPATVLVEKISSAIGVLYEPRRIRSIAKAEADAERIRAVAQIEISDLQRRALERLIAEQAKKQDNIETITAKALPGVSDTAAPHQVEDDWITYFFDKARLISDDEMQALWAKVLAGEANHPGTYSKRTVGFLASLDREDAMLFSNLCGLCWNVGSPVPLVYDIDDPIYAQADVTPLGLAHLDDIGLITYQYPVFARLTGIGKRTRVEYYGDSIDLEFSRDSDNSLGLGHVYLSKVGKELAPLCGSLPVPGFLEYVLRKWMMQSIVPSSRYPRSAAAD